MQELLGHCHAFVLCIFATTNDCFRDEGVQGHAQWDMHPVLICWNLAEHFDRFVQQW